MKLSIKKFGREVLEVANKKAPALLIGSGTGLLLVTTVLAVKATPKALAHLEEKKRELRTDKLTAKEVISATWKDYSGAVAAGVAGTASIIAGTVAGEKRLATATAAAAIGKVSEEVLDEYKEVVRQTVTPAKQDEIGTRIAEKHFGLDEKVRPYEACPDGKQWFRESYTGQRIISTVDEVRAALAQINEDIAYDNVATINDLLYKIGGEQVSGGDYRGWRQKVEYRLEPVVLPGGKGTGFEIQYHRNPRDLVDD